MTAPLNMDAVQGRLGSLVQSHPLPTWRPVAWGVILLLTALGGWAFHAELDEVTVAMGEVVPSGRVRVIQHLEGGIVKVLHVREGDAVSEGDPLIQLDLATSGLNVDELQVRLDSHRLTKARLEAETERAAEIVFPVDEALRRPTLVESERRAFQARLRELESTIRVLNEQIKQRNLEVEELDAKRRATEKNLALAHERFRMSTSLLSQGLTARMDHLQLEAEVESLEGEIQTITASIPRARAQVAEAEERLAEETIRFQREAEEKLGETEQAIARVQELMKQATDQGFRALIRSPVDGVVKNMRYFTLGGVVRPGEPIMEIVPSGEKLVIEARLNPVDRGYVQVGQPAVVKMTTYDFIRYGGLDGTVTLIAADTTTDQDGIPHYRVVVETEKTDLGDDQGKLPITPGMEATVDIHTGTKTVMEYLIKPVLKLKHESFRER